MQSSVHGVAFIAHPQNPYPTVWRRDYLYWGIQASIEAKGGIQLDEGQALTLRYRVVVHQGDAASAGLEEKARSLGKAEKAAGPHWLPHEVPSQDATGRADADVEPRRPHVPPLD
ncbi:MAG: hypothetical protein FJ290_13160 [Planctomycetes bacterium]|nr:hypothetical protein [Planctomycetota bacterium]